MAWKPVILWLSPQGSMVFGIVAAVVGLFLLLLRPPAPFGPAQFHRLQEGMTRAEVVATLGCPAGDYRPASWRNPDWFVSPSDAIAIVTEERGPSLRELDEWPGQSLEEWRQARKPVPPPPRVQKARWLARDYGIEVAFDERGQVIHLSLWRMVPPPPPNDIPRWIRWRFGG